MPDTQIPFSFGLWTVGWQDLDLDHLAAQAGAHAAKYGVRGRDGRALLDSLLDQATDSDARRRDQMATLLSTLDHPRQRILLELATRTGQQTR